MKRRKQNAKLREKARVLGEKFYTPVEECQRGHLSERSVATGKCMECCRINRAKFDEKQEYTMPGEVKARKLALKKAHKAREAAIANGEIHYKSGRDCVNGHKNPWRYVTASNCMDCNTEKQLELTKKRRALSATKPKKKLGRPRKVAQKPKKTPRVVITKDDHKEESFAAMARRVYERNQNW